MLHLYEFNNLGTDFYVQRMKNKHGDKYTYDDSSIEVRKDSKGRPKTHLINIYCPEHKIKFDVRADNLGKCPECSGRADFVKKSKKKFGDKFDYSEIETIKSTSDSNRTDSIKNIKCAIHGFIPIIRKDQFLENGCPKCNMGTITKEEFIKNARNIHRDNRYDYSDVVYKGVDHAISIKCTKKDYDGFEHGYFEQTPFSHLKGHGCPICNESKGERFIRDFLKSHDIDFKSQKTYPDLKGISGYPLKYDFYLPDFNMCIEYDGEQHYKPSRYSKDTDKNYRKFLEVQANDKIKNEYCIENNIILERFGYLSNKYCQSFKEIKIKLMEILGLSESMIINFKLFEGRQKNAIRKYVIVANEGNMKRLASNCFLVYKVNSFKSKILGTVKSLSLHYAYFIDLDNFSDLRRSNLVSNSIDEYNKMVPDNYLYTSDDLEDIKKHLLILADLRKYNI